MSYGAPSPKRASPQDSQIHRLSSLRPALGGVNRDGEAPGLRPFTGQRAYEEEWGTAELIA